MTQLQSEFPIFKNNPGLIYLDSASTTQKPQMVIDAQKHFLEHSYANIHRGKYELSQRSDELYFETKKRLAQFIHANSPFEICFTANATSASNLLVGSLLESKYFVPGDEILINIQEHHASIVPWQIAAKKYGLILKYIPYDSEYQCDIQALQSSLNPKTRAFIGSRVSNVTGSILDFEKVRSIV